MELQILLMHKYEYSIRPEIAKLESNRSPIPSFSLGANLDPHSGPDSSPIQISFNVNNDVIRPSEVSNKFYLYYGIDNNDQIYYTKTIGFGIKIKLHLKNLFKNTKLTVNSPYYKFVRVRLDNVYPPGVHLADILSVNLLERRFTPLHCAAISSQGEASLLVAPPDTGKTVTTLLALNRGYSYMAEDIAVVDDKHAYINPYTSTFLHNKEFRGYNPLNKLFVDLPKKIPLLSAYITPKLSVANFIKNFKVEGKARIKNIFILDRGKSNIETIGPDEAARRTMIINRNEFSYYKNPLLLAYSYFNPSLNLDNLMKIEQELVHTITRKSNCFILKTLNPKEYMDLISKALKR